MRTVLIAEALPILNWRRPSSPICMIAVRVSSPGWPWVMRYGCPKTLAEARMVIVRTKIVTGRSPGRVTCRNRCQAVAPSSSAASYSSAGMSWRPARKMTML